MNLRRVVDVNADVGEGGDDERLMPYLTSASIACGGHAGDAETMAATLAAARRSGILTGAHPGYPEREGFGRRDIEISSADLSLELIRQLEAIASVASQEGARITHVKTHGALYNRAWHDAGVAAVVARALVAAAPGAAVFCPPGSAQEAAAERAGLAVVREAFADRRYGADGSLLPRTRPGAVITDPDDLREQLLSLASIEFDTVCVHSDNPAAAELLAALGAVIRELGWTIAPYAIP